MLDPLLRRWIDPPLDRAGAWLARRGMSANAFSLAGLAVGLTTIPLLAWERYDAALALQLLLSVCSESMGTHDSGYDDWWCVD